MVSEESDQILIEKAQQGDKEAFGQLVLRYQHKVGRLVRYYVPDQAQSLDLTQDVFIKVYAALAKFRGDSAFYTWLYRVAVNTVKNHLILNQHHFTASDLEAEPQDSASNQSLPIREDETPEHCLLRDEIEKTIFDTIDKLPEDARLAFTLREIEGLSYEEIADVLNCPIGTVRSRIFRARELIEHEIDPLLKG